MIITRENSAQYGKAFEQAIANLINFADGEKTFYDIDETAEDSQDDLGSQSIFHFDIDRSDLENIYEDAHLAVMEMMDYGFNTSRGVTRVGDSTSNESCDLILVDGTEIEVKYVQKAMSNGTYYNTSIDKVAEHFGFGLYSDYLRSNGYYDYLDGIIQESGYSVNYDKRSPLNVDASKWVRAEENHEVYEAAKEFEWPLRIEWVRDFYDYIMRTGQANDFLNCLLDKNLSGKHAPSYFVVFSRDSNACRVVSADDIMLDECCDGNLTQCSIVFDTVRATFAWQNGTGLQNPTLRVFVK